MSTSSEKKVLALPEGKLSYRVNGTPGGGTILFVHGNSFSSETFELQLSRPELQSYELMALDLPGHGESDRRPGQYSLRGYAAAVKDFMTALGLKQVILAGHSLGGHIALEVLGRFELPQLAGALIWGTPPLALPPDFAAACLPNPSTGLFYKPDLSDEEVDAILAICYNDQGKITPSARRAIRQTDPAARAEIMASVAALDFLDELQVLRTSPVPIALLNCTEDQIISPSYISSLRAESLWQEASVSLRGGHMAHEEDPQAFAKLVALFAQDLSLRNLGSSLRSKSDQLSTIQL